jgi:hypothetical protein
MTLLTAGCSFSSGWGFEDPTHTWTHKISQKLGMPLHNVAETAASNQDIFLSVLKKQHQLYDIKLVQWTALNRITVSPSPINPKVILSFHNAYLEQAAPEFTQNEIKTFVQMLAVLNQDWKHFFDLVDMIEILQNDPSVYFINGLLPWDSEFFFKHWLLPFDDRNLFLTSLLQLDEFDDSAAQKFLNQVIQARDRIDQSRWINLTNSWQSSKLDVVSTTDSHPGLLSQNYFAEKIYNFIKEKNA